MEFNQSILTQKGRTLMAKAISGRANIVFTKMQSSSTQYQMTQLEMLTSLSNVKQRADVVAEKNNGVTVKVKGTFDNYNLNSGYDFRTVGLYANDPDEGEILYSVSTASVSGYMPPNTGISATGIDITFYVEVGNAEKVHLEIDPAGFATKAELRALEINVAYADNLSGDGFSKTDNSKLFKGYSVKNSTSPADYRWERNVDSLQVGGRNLLKDTANFGYSGMPSGAKDGWLEASDATLESEKYNGLTVRSLKNVTRGLAMCRYKFTGFNLGDTYTLSFWAKGTINKIKCFFHGDTGFIGAKVVNASIPYSDRTVFGDGMCVFTNPQITNWTRISITWQLDSKGDINVVKKVLINTDEVEATGGDLYVCGVKLEKGNQATDWSPAPEDLTLNSNPVNSILTTLSAENPSTTLGGTWTQLGTESKFSQTIYYWKRTK